HVGWKEAIWPLPHQKQTAFGRFLKLKAVWKVKVRVEQHQFSSGLAQQQGIGDFAPTRVAASEGAQISMPREQLPLTLCQVLLRVNFPQVCVRIERRYGS